MRPKIGLISTQSVLIGTQCLMPREVVLGAAAHVSRLMQRSDSLSSIAIRGGKRPTTIVISIDGGDDGLAADRMECGERSRLEQEYFRALGDQQKIGSARKLLAQTDKPELTIVGEMQADAAIEEAYTAWNAFNEHLLFHRCGH